MKIQPSLRGFVQAMCCRVLLNEAMLGVCERRLRQWGTRSQAVQTSESYWDAEWR